MAEKEVRKLAAVMFTDIEGYTAFVQQDEAAALKKVSTHRKFLEQYTEQYNGKVIAFYGDGSLSIYESALDAVHCGIAMQKAYQGDHPIPVRIGIHLGDIVFRDETVYGDGVNIASRIQASGIPGSVYVSDRVQSELANHPEVRTKSIGKKKLKNVAAPIEVFVVTNDGLNVPSGMTKMPDLKKYYRYIPLLLLGMAAWWYFQQRVSNNLFGEQFKAESISVPVFSNNTGDDGFDFVSQMAAHWITKELSKTPDANVVSYESASEMIEMSGLSLSSARGRAQYASLTGAVNVVEASFTRIGNQMDSLVMSGWISNLQSGKIVQPLSDVRCKSDNPMDCIQQMSGNIKGYWVSRDAHVLTPPNYEAYKAYLAARKAWRGEDNAIVFDHLNEAIKLDPDFIDPYFLMLDFFYNMHMNQAAYDTIQSIRRHFTELDDRQSNMLNYHTADVNGHNAEAYAYFMNEYEEDPKDLFTNTSAIVLAMLYRHDPPKALEFFRAIPMDSMQIEGCYYCADRRETAIWAAMDADSMELAGRLATQISKALYSRKSFGALIMYYVWQGDTTKIDQLLVDQRNHPDYEPGWEYLNYLASRLFALRGDAALTSRYARMAIDAYAKLPGFERMLGRSYYLDNQFDKAIPLLKTAIKNHPGEYKIVAELGLVYARQGNKPEAKKIIDQLEAGRSPFEYGLTEYNQARIYALLGEKEEAIRLLGVAIDKGVKYDYWITFDHDPDIMVLRDDPGYRKVMEKFRR